MNVSRISIKNTDTKKKRKSRAKTIQLVSSEGSPVYVRERDFNKFLKYVSEGQFCKVSIEVKSDCVLCTYETENGQGKAVLEGIKDI